MKQLFQILAASFLITSVSWASSPVTVCKANPHYFFYKDKPLVLITSDQHYGAVIDLDFDYRKFLNYLSDNGMNLTRIYPGAMFETPDKYLKGNPLGPLAGRQLLPWAKSALTGANPLLAEAGKPAFKYDLDKWNPDYFKRLKAFAELARQKNIIVEVAFFNGMYEVCWPLMAMYHENNIQVVGKYEVKDCGLFTSFTPQNQEVIRYQKAYIVKLTTELNEFDNVIFNICDEPSLQGRPDGSVIFLPDSTVVPWINAMKDAFLNAEKKLPNKHILGQTVQSLSPDFSGEAWCDWLPTEYITSAQKALDINFKSNKPLMNVESNYFGISLTKNPYDADAVRLEAWWFMLSGGAGNINLNGEYFRGQETGGSITQKQIVPQRKVLKKFMNNLDLINLLPFTGFSGLPSDAICKALAQPGKQYAFYLFHGAPESEWGSHFTAKPGNYQEKLSISAVPEGTYKVVWIDPVSGKIIQSENLSCKGGNLSLKTPAYKLDIALRITNAGKNNNEETIILMNLNKKLV
jgi:hypothetical protein